MDYAPNYFRITAFSGRTGSPAGDYDRSGRSVLLLGGGGGLVVGFTVLGIIVGLLIVLTALFLRPRTWNRLALRTHIDSQVQPVEIDKQVEVGVQGTTLTRLAPMGKVQIGEQIFEAKSLDSYIDPRQQVRVIGYDNATLVVRATWEEND